MAIVVQRKAMILHRLKLDKERLKWYLDREKDMLTGGVQLYTIGSRNLQHYTTSLAEIRAAIKDLKDEIAELEAELAGFSRRRAVAAVPRDW